MVRNCKNQNLNKCIILYKNIGASMVDESLCVYAANENKSEYKVL